MPVFTLFYNNEDFFKGNSVSDLTAVSTNATSKIFSQQHIPLVDAKGAVKGALDRTESAIKLQGQVDTHSLINLVITVIYKGKFEQYFANFAFTNPPDAKIPEKERLNLTSAVGTATFKTAVWFSNPSSGRPKIVFF